MSPELGRRTFDGASSPATQVGEAHDPCRGRAFCQLPKERIALEENYILRRRLPPADGRVGVGRVEGRQLLQSQDVLFREYALAFAEEGPVADRGVLATGIVH